jgi:uridine kinase
MAPMASQDHFRGQTRTAVERIGRPVIRSSVDGFHNSREIPTRQGFSRGFYLDSYDYAALRRYRLDPLEPGGSGVYCSAVFDHVIDSLVPVQTRVAPPGAALILGRLFLHRRKLHDIWDFSIFLDAPFEVMIPRGAMRGRGWEDRPKAAAATLKYLLFR